MNRIDGPVRVADLAQQREHLRLHRHVERGRRLVGDQQLGLERQAHRDHRPLLHAAGELVRVVAGRGGRARGGGPRRAARPRALGRRPGAAAMQGQRLADLRADPQRRVEARAARPAGSAPPGRRASPGARAPACRAARGRRAGSSPPVDRGRRAAAGRAPPTRSSSCRCRTRRSGRRSRPAPTARLTPSTTAQARGRAKVDRRSRSRTSSAGAVTPCSVPQMRVEQRRATRRRGG